MIQYNIESLRSLSHNKICSIPYLDEEINHWKNGNISFLLKSNAPQFIKDILKHKKRENSSRFKSTWYFGEGYVASILGDHIQKGWFSSFKWLYDPDWITGKNPEKEKDPIISRLKSEFYTGALKEFIDFNKLTKLQKIWGREKPKAPDLWLIDKNNHHYLIEVKKDTDKQDEGNKQLLGLALLEKYFNMSIFIVYLHPENKNPLSDAKEEKWLANYNAVKAMIR